MHNFVEAFKFIGRNGQIPGAPPFPTLVHLTLETLKIAGSASGNSTRSNDCRALIPIPRAASRTSMGTSRNPVSVFRNRIRSV